MKTGNAPSQIKPFFNRILQVFFSDKEFVVEKIEYEKLYCLLI